LPIHKNLLLSQGFLTYIYTRSFKSRNLDLKERIKIVNDRAGIFIRQPGGYYTFVPKPLPPDPPIKYDAELQLLLSNADRELARLDGITTVLPNPELFVSMYVKKEALISSQIEGTQASLEGVLEFETNLKPKDNIEDLKEVVNYIKALHFGIKRQEEIPISNRLIKELHEILLVNTKGSNRNPGNFRKFQNWIGPPGGTIRDAIFIPPPANEVENCMAALEKFIHAEDKIPTLVKCAFIHSQFETIHPFLDGNGRIGRLLITLYLHSNNILSYPLLYLSYFFKKYRVEYYDYLLKVRTEGEWENWIAFFLQAIIETSQNAIITARNIIDLQKSLINNLRINKVTSPLAVILIEKLFEHPILNLSHIQEILDTSRQTASDLINKFKKLGILTEITGKERYRIYQFSDYLKIIEEGTKLNNF